MAYPITRLDAALEGRYFQADQVIDTMTIISPFTREPEGILSGL